MGVGGQSDTLADLPLGTTRRMGGEQDASGRERKISTPPGLDPRNVRHVASRYSGWAIPAHLCVYCVYNNCFIFCFY
jgi:hypothetical protein